MCVKFTLTPATGKVMRDYMAVCHDDRLTITDHMTLHYDADHYSVRDSDYAASGITLMTFENGYVALIEWSRKLVRLTRHNDAWVRVNYDTLEELRSHLVRFARWGWEQIDDARELALVRGYPVITLYPREYHNFEAFDYHWRYPKFTWKED